MNTILPYIKDNKISIGQDISLCIIEILLSLTYSRMVLMVCWHYGMPFDANGCVSTQVNVDWKKWMYFYVNDFEVGIIDSIYSGNEK